MVAKTIAVKTETKAEPSGVWLRTNPKEVDPDNVKVNVEGLVCRSWVVHFPEGMTQDDLRDPHVWKRSMTRRQTAFGKYDELVIFAADESWVARARVAFVKTAEAHIVVESIKPFRNATQSLFRDESYHIAFEGGSYRVKRNQDGQQMTSVGFTTEASAIAEIHRMSGGKVG